MKKIAEFDTELHRHYNNPESSKIVQNIKNKYSYDIDFSNILDNTNEKFQLIITSMFCKNDLLMLNSSSYRERLIQELNAILIHPYHEMLDFYLIYEDIAYFFEKNNTVFNIGRGSSASSLILYLLGITKIDPLKYGLLFERYWSTTEFPDIDLDLAPDDRHKLLTYLEDKYPKDYSHIQTNSYWKLKGAINEVFRGDYEISHYLNSIVDDNTPIPKYHQEYNNDPQSEKVKFQNLLDRNKFFNLHIDEEKRSKINEMLDTLKNTGKHAAGIILSNNSIMTMEEVDNFKICKLDFLGLNAYSKIKSSYTLEKLKSVDLSSLSNEHCDLIKKRYEKNNAENSSNKFFGASQMALGKKYGIGFKSIEDLSKIMASCVNEDNGLFYSRTKPFISSDPYINEILKETDNKVLYQEQLMQVISYICNVDLQESRTIVSSILKEQLVCDYSMTEIKLYVKDKEYLIDIKFIEDFKYIQKMAPLCFLKAHTISYSHVLYFESFA